MEKKEFKRPSMKVMNVQTETILAGSGNESKQGGVTVEGLTTGNDGNSIANW